MTKIIFIQNDQKQL